jgi:hypothetical protein
MAESTTHIERVSGLVRWMQQQGVMVTHASGGLNLPDPYRIGRHEPDAIGTKDGIIWIGEAKVGNDFSVQTSQEQFVDFSTSQMTDSGAACPFVLCVPKGFDGAAWEAVRAAGGSSGNLTVIA